MGLSSNILWYPIADEKRKKIVQSILEKISAAMGL